MGQGEVFLELMDKKEVAILRVLFNCKQDFYLRELAKASNVPAATTLRILRKLVKLELVAVTAIKKLKLYSIAKNTKTQALASILRADLQALEYFIQGIKAVNGIQAVFLHGEETKDKANVLLIGDGINVEDLKNIVAAIHTNYNFNISYLIVTLEQYKQMSQMGLWDKQRKILWER